ncbi:MAG: methylcobamide--CoM methyltransferase [Oscillospiraceae bacterium]|jgi:[methyl-Co(III) methanol-specific corrinoid protein]:coenzyme M methyltransferase|nr:methylcobamide--CoM methyltransferase [Oscillospiraceae bacterium]
MSDDLSPRERLLRRLSKQKTDRPPVICPGGMMNAAIIDVMERTGHTLPEGHSDAAAMTALVRDVAELTGFENYGAPFCMTIEAEALGSEVDLGSLSCEPKIKTERWASLADVSPRFAPAERSGRVRAVSDTLEALAGGDIPVIGSVTGPISAAASLVEPMTFLKQLRRERESAHRVIDAVTDWLIGYAQILIDSGADVISIADPTATGEILGPRFFEEYALRYINKLADAIRASGRPVIVHICGRLDAVSDLTARLRGDALSTDAMVSLRAIKQSHPEVNTMGNLSTILLQDAEPERIIRGAEALLRDGVDIIAPACGLSVTTPLENIRAFTGLVQGARP